MGKRQSILDRTSLVRGGGTGLPGASQTRELTLRVVVVVAPASASDALTVADPKSEYGYTVPSGNWAPRGETLPSVGNAAVLLFDSDGDAWVPMWSPE